MSTAEARALYRKLWTADLTEGTAKGDDNWNRLLQVEGILLKGGVDVIALRKR